MKIPQVFSSKFCLVTPNGEYYANSLTVLMWEVFKHRTWHMFKGDGWID